MYSISSIGVTISKREKHTVSNQLAPEDNLLRRYHSKERVRDANEQTYLHDLHEKYETTKARKVHYFLQSHSLSSYRMFLPF